MSYNDIYNTKFTTFIDIKRRLSQMVKGKELDNNEMIEWCADCEIDEIRSAEDWMLYKDVKLTVDDNKKALLPCNMYRLLDIMDNINGNRVVNYNNGTYLILDDNYAGNYVYISYYGLPVTKGGMPLILKGHEKACTYYCMKMIYMEDYLTGKMDGQRWGWIEATYEDALIDAVDSTKNLTRNEAEEIIRINHNMIPKMFVSKYNID